MVSQVHRPPRRDPAGMWEQFKLSRAARKGTRTHAGGEGMARREAHQGISRNVEHLDPVP